MGAVNEVAGLIENEFAGIAVAKLRLPLDPLKLGVITNSCALCTFCTQRRSHFEFDPGGALLGKTRWKIVTGQGNGRHPGVKGAAQICFIISPV